MIGLMLIGFAANEFAYTLNRYPGDSYTVYASSRLATLALVSGVMPPFARVFDRQSIAGRDRRLRLIGQNPGCD